MSISWGFDNMSLIPKKKKKNQLSESQTLYHSKSTKGCNPSPLRAPWGTANPHSPKRGDTSTVSSLLKSLEYKQVTMKWPDSNPDFAVLIFNPCSHFFSWINGGAEPSDLIPLSYLVLMAAYPMKESCLAQPCTLSSFLSISLNVPSGVPDRLPHALPAFTPIQVKSGVLHSYVTSTQQSWL